MPDQKTTDTEAAQATLDPKEVQTPAKERKQRVAKEVKPEPAKPNFLTDLFALQSDLDTIKFIKASTGSTGKRDYSYQDLPGLQDGSKPPLRKHNFMWYTLPSSNTVGDPTLKYILLHITGEKIADEVTLPKGLGAQDMGGAITYFRRYVLAAVLDIAAEDDDGKQAQEASTEAVTQIKAKAAVDNKKYIQYIEAISQKLEIDTDPDIYEMTTEQLIAKCTELKAKLNETTKS